MPQMSVSKLLSVVRENISIQHPIGRRMSDKDYLLRSPIIASMAPVEHGNRHVKNYLAKQKIGELFKVKIVLASEVKRNVPSFLSRDSNAASCRTDTMRLVIKKIFFILRRSTTLASTISSHISVKMSRPED